MLFKPILGAALSGKLGGIVAAHGPGGAYFRVLAIPTNPATPEQTAIRNAVTNLSGRWVNILTEAQRETWKTYATNVTHTNRIGEPINLSGLTEYVRSNVTRSQSAALVRINQAPDIFDLGEFTGPTAAINAGTQLITVTFEEADAWPGESGSAMMLYASRPQNQTINFFDGPYRFAGPILGVDGAPPTSPQTIAVPFVVVADQRVHMYVRVTRNDGRLSGKNRFFADVA